MKGFRELLDWSDRSDLGRPPVPTALRPPVRKLDEWHWGTREVSTRDRYAFQVGLGRELVDPAGDYLSVSHVGHGINSYFFNYQLVHGPLVLFLQTPLAGVYMDNRRQAELVRARFAAAGPLVDAVANAVAVGWEAPGRLVVAELWSDPGQGFAAWLAEPLEEPQPAIRWINARLADEDSPGAASRAALALLER